MQRGPPAESGAIVIRRGCSSLAAASRPRCGRAWRLPPDKPGPCRLRPIAKRPGSGRLNLRPLAPVGLWQAEEQPFRMLELQLTPTVGHLRLRDTRLLLGEPRHRCTPGLCMTLFHEAQAPG